MTFQRRLARNDVINAGSSRHAQRAARTGGSNTCLQWHFRFGSHHCADASVGGRRRSSRGELNTSRWVSGDAAAACVASGCDVTPSTGEGDRVGFPGHLLSNWERTECTCSRLSYSVLFWWSQDFCFCAYCILYVLSTCPGHILMGDKFKNVWKLLIDFSFHGFHIAISS